MIFHLSRSSQSRWDSDFSSDWFLSVPSERLRYTRHVLSHCRIPAWQEEENRAPKRRHQINIVRRTVMLIGIKQIKCHWRPMCVYSKHAIFEITLTKIVIC